MSGEVYVCGTGGWTGPLPGDPDNNVILSATPAFGGIDVSFTYPATNPHAVAHALLYRGLLDNFDGALLLTVMSGNFFYDKIDTATRYYYWIKLVSVNGTVSDPIGPASAIARPTIEAVIEQLTGQIDAGHLAQSLKGNLDQISVLGSQLLDEITARENAEITLSEALQAVNAGVAEALNFVQTEINTRASSDAALAESINLTASTLGGDFAAVTQSMQTHIDTLGGQVSDIGALYTAQVNVNGLIGGFGIYNDGTFVEAGFDVDRFWVGRTGPDKKKPFIISNGEVFIDDAVIQSLVFHKLRADDGSFLFEAGKLGNAYLAVNAAQSTNFLTGVSGWRLQPNGDAEFASGNFRGDISGSTGAFSGTLTAGTVDLSKMVGVTHVFSNPGAFSVPAVPADFLSMRITAIGGGGGGGGSGGLGGAGGGGGGRGTVSVYTEHNLTPGTVFSGVVGSRGEGGAASPPQDSNASTSGGNGTAGTASYVTGKVTAAPGQPGMGGLRSDIASTTGTPGGGAGGSIGGQAGENVHLATGYGDGQGGGCDGGAGGPATNGAGAGGKGGDGTADYQSASNPGAPGGPGKVIVEFFNPNGVVIRSEWNKLIAQLNAQNISYDPNL